MLDDACYLGIKGILQREGEWTDNLEEIEKDMKKIALQFV